MAREPDEIHHGGGKHRVDALDVEIARLAARRHGVVAARQLTGIGASSRAIERRVDKSRLHRIHRGVYAVGHDRLTIRGRWMARHRSQPPAGALADTGFARGVTAGALEERFAAFIRRHRLPPPLLNAPVEAEGRRCIADRLWPDARVIAELQSVARHATPHAMTRDAERTRRLTLAGWTVAYVTWSQLKEPAAQLQDDLRRLLRPARRRC